MGQILLFLLFFGLWGHCFVWFRIFSYLTCLCISGSNPSSTLFHPFLSFFSCINIWFFFWFLCWVVEGCAKDNCLCTPTLNLSLSHLWGHLNTFCPTLCSELFLLCVCGWVGVCALIDRCAIPFQLCCSLTHLTLHYAAFMLFLGCKLHFWGKEKWPTVPVIMLSSVRMRKYGGKDKWSEIKFLNIRQMIC